MYIYNDSPDLVNLPGLSERLHDIAWDLSLNMLHIKGELDAISLPTRDDKVLIGTHLGYMLLLPESALQNIKDNPSGNIMRPSTGLAEFDY